MNKYFTPIIAIIFIFVSIHFGFEFQSRYPKLISLKELCVIDGPFLQLSFLLITVFNCIYANFIKSVDTLNAHSVVITLYIFIKILYTCAITAHPHTTIGFIYDYMFIMLLYAVILLTLNLIAYIAVQYQLKKDKV